MALIYYALIRLVLLLFHNSWYGHLVRVCVQMFVYRYYDYSDTPVHASFLVIRRKCRAAKLLLVTIIVSDAVLIVLSTIWQIKPLYILLVNLYDVLFLPFPRNMGRSCRSSMFVKQIAII